MDISPLLFNKGRVERDVFLYYRGPLLYAARLGLWKAHFITRSAYGPDKAEPHDPPLLFNLGEDPGEKWDRAAQQPEVAAKIREAVARRTATMTPAPSRLTDTEE